MEGIKNLIIDFGGVIINLTRNRCVEAFESFGVPDVRDCISRKQIRQRGGFLRILGTPGLRGVDPGRRAGAQ